MNPTGDRTPPIIAHRKGFYYEVKAGKRYLWCACGRSRTQPFCDGSHVGSEFLPIALKAERDEEVIFCGCKHTAATIDPSQRHKMAERHYQMLVNREHGSTLLTQFIGNIPLSKAEPHRHLYEEALIFLNGAGVVWTERTKTTVAAGDILFLPRKQVHSVQCTTPGGFDIVGVIYPGDNPSINY
ncbi:MAG TPA: CDGSH iron-sulfur domain-containing protein [Steroidobacteraceae bacterium]